MGKISEKKDDGYLGMVKKSGFDDGNQEGQYSQKNEGMGDGAVSVFSIEPTGNPCQSWASADDRFGVVNVGQQGKQAGAKNG